MSTIVNEEVFTHPVKMPLTEKELLAYTDELTALDTQQKDIALRHEGEKNRFKAEQKSVNQNQERILNLLKTKEEIKQVECYNDFNFFEGIVEIKRCDNQQTVTTRKITNEEYQQNLSFDKDDE